MATTDANNDVFEKANAYDNAIRKAKELLSKCKRAYDRRTMVYRAEDIEYIFPELKHSDDERTRKEIIYYFKQIEFVTEESAKRVTRWLSWLESMKKTPEKKQHSIT